MQYFALTVRDPTFNPVFKSPDYPINDTSFRVTLGVSTFSAVPEQPDYIGGCLGVNYIEYYETRYLGRPGGYEEYAFGVNEAGWGKPTDSLITLLSKYQKLCTGPTFRTSHSALFGISFGPTNPGHFWPVGASVASESTKRDCYTEDVFSAECPSPTVAVPDEEDEHSLASRMGYTG